MYVPKWYAIVVIVMALAFGSGKQAKVFAEITEYAKEKGVTIVTKVVE